MTKITKHKKIPLGPLGHMILGPLVPCSFNSHICQTTDGKPILPPAVAAQDCIAERLKRHLLRTAWSKLLSNMRKTALTLNSSWGESYSVGSLAHFECIFWTEI